MQWLLLQKHSFKLGSLQEIHFLSVHEFDFTNVTNLGRLDLVPGAYLTDLGRLGPVPGTYLTNLGRLGPVLRTHLTNLGRLGPVLGPGSEQRYP